MSDNDASDDEMCGFRFVKYSDEHHAIEAYWGVDV